MKRINYFILITLTICLSACAHKMNTPKILYKPATRITTANNITSEQQPVSQINKIKLFYSNTDAKELKGITAVRQVNKQAVALPRVSSAINSTIIFQYQEGELYPIYTTPLNVTDVALQAGEQIISVASGDTVRWQVSKAVEGVGENRVEHLLIKPLSKNINTTLVIMTNFRTYHLLLKATPDTFMIAVKWQYEDHTMLLTTLADKQQENTNALIGNIQNLNISYQLKLLRGNKPDWTPAAVFDDGNKTYIEFPATMQSSPDLFIQQDGEMASINYRVVGRYYVIDQLIKSAELVSNNGKTIIEVIRN